MKSKFGEWGGSDMSEDPFGIIAFTQNYDKVKNNQILLSPVQSSLEDGASPEPPKVRKKINFEKEILIFDLDDTITHGCFTLEHTEVVGGLIQKIRDNRTRVFIVTSRPTDFTLEYMSIIEKIFLLLEFSNYEEAYSELQRILSEASFDREYPYLEQFAKNTFTIENFSQASLNTKIMHVLKQIFENKYSNHIYTLDISWIEANFEEIFETLKQIKEDIDNHNLDEYIDNIINTYNEKTNGNIEKICECSKKQLQNGEYIFTAGITGLIKFLQAKEIILKQCEKDDFYPVYFFDDAFHNYFMFNVMKYYYGDVINITFVGGLGKCVDFDEYVFK